MFALIENIILFAFTVLCVYGQPLGMDGNGNVVQLVAIPTPDNFVAEESHPFEVVDKVPQTMAMEVSDDDSYESTAPVRVIAVPEGPIVVPKRPNVYRFSNNNNNRFGGDLSASASDLQAAATGYGHGGGGHGGGHGPSGWLDMGAYSSGYGAFGWYADYPVGGGYGYGR